MYDLCICYSEKRGVLIVAANSVVNDTVYVEFCIVHPNPAIYLPALE